METLNNQPNIGMDECAVGDQQIHPTSNKLLTLKRKRKLTELAVLLLEIMEAEGVVGYEKCFVGRLCMTIGEFQI